MDFDNLRCFVAAAHHLSFRRAAKEVHLSPAAFSDRIARLEEQLDARLFDRTTRRVALTSAGDRLLPAARKLLSDAGDLRTLVRADDSIPPLTLTLGTRHELGVSWLLPALESLASAGVGLHRTLHLRFSDSHALLDALRAGTIDAVVTSFRLTTPGLSYATLHPERYVFVAAPALLERSPLTEPAHSAQHTLLDAHADLPLFRYLLDAYTGPEVWSFGSTRWVGTIAAIRLLVLAGRGVAVLPRYYVQPDLDAGRLTRLMADTEPVQDWFRLVWRRDAPRQEALRELATQLADFPLR